MNDQITSTEINNMTLFNYLKNHEWDKFTDYLDNPSFDFDINSRDEQQNYFISYAILYNKIDIVNKLIKCGARIDVVDQEEHSMLYIPIKFNYTEMLDLLLSVNSTTIGISILDVKDKTFKIPLHYAIILKNVDAVKSLLKCGSNPNIKEKNGLNALHLAVYSRSYDICKYVIEYSTDINSRCTTGETALHLACNLQLTEIVELLINNGINVNAQDFNYEVTALHYSIQLNNKKNTILLLQQSTIQPNLQDVTGNTCVHYAIMDDSYELFSLLITSPNTKNILNLNLWNIDGEIPLHTLLKKDMLYNMDNYLTMLISKSNLILQDNDGCTCLHYLIKHDIWKEYIPLLENKKLDIFTKNIQNVSPYDMIDKNDNNTFIDMVTNSYYNKLKSTNVNWQHEWEDICGTNFNDDSNELLKKYSDGYYNDDTESMCKHIIKTKILSLVYNVKSTKNKVCDEKSFPFKKHKTCINMTEGTPYPYCTFTGSTLDVLIGLIFLLKKHSDTCSPLSKNLSENKELCKFYKSIGIIVNSRCEFLNFEIVWVQGKLYLMDSFFDQFKKCKKTKRFIIMPLGIEMHKGNHANYLIYDKLKNEVERFEPHGATTPLGLNYNPNLLDDVLASRFKTIDEHIKYIRPIDYLPKIGFQLMDVYESYNKKIGDPEGFCALWSIWYTDMRLTYNDFERGELVSIMLKSMRSQNISFKNMIRNYAMNVVSYRDEILKHSDLDVNDWQNDQYDHDQINSILEILMSELTLLLRLDAVDE
jgi:ankyrin repeat protein